MVGGIGGGSSGLIQGVEGLLVVEELEWGQWGGGESGNQRTRD